jgi:hypothetical protein
MRYQAIASTESLDIHLTSAESQKLECFKLTAKNIFKGTIKIK